MVLSLFLVVLIAAITFFQSIHGLFNGIITCVMAILCCAFAFAVHEYVALELLMGWKPNLALPLALVLSFILPLIALRSAADAMIRRSSLVPSIVDKAGGVIFGFVTAMIIVGVLALGIQMLPFGGRFLQFCQYDVTADDFDPTEEPSGILLSPDRFATGLASMMSAGIFSGKSRWEDDHPDYVREVGWDQTVPLDVRCFAPRDGITRVEFFTEEEHLYHLKEEGGDYGAVSGYQKEAVGPSGSHQFWALRIKLGHDAEDADKKHRFSPYQIRIVGTVDGVPVHYCPVAVRQNVNKQRGATPEYRYVDYTDKRKSREWAMAELYKPEDDGTINVLFEVHEKFKPRFVEYKMGARKPLTKSDRPIELAEEPEAPGGSGEPSERPRPRRSSRGTRGGRTHGADVIGAKFSDALPHSRVKYETVGDADIRRGQLREGHIIATIGEDDRGREVTRFEVPEGKALLQIDAVNLRAGSLLGRAKSFAVKTVKNFIVTDDRGNEYKLCGQIALADVGDDRVVEVQYYPEVIGSIGGVKPFSRIKDRDLSDSDTYELYFLFLVDSGRKVVKFSTSGQRGGEDISDLGLVAP